jgi:hypothetical protein
VVTVTATVEDNSFDACSLGALGYELTNALGLGGLEATVRPWLSSMT